MSALRDKIRRLIHIRTGFLCRIAAGLIICLIGWVLYNFVGNRLLRPIARRRIEQMTGMAVEIASIDFKSTGFVRMSYLVIGEPKIQPYESKILRANKVDVRFSLASIFRLKPEIKKITFRDYILNAQYNSDAMQWNLALLDIQKSPKAEYLLPHIELKNGILKLSKVTKNELVDITIIEVDGELRPQPGPGCIYSFYFESTDRATDRYYFARGIWESGRRGKVMLNGRIPPTDLPLLGNRWAINDLVIDLSYDQNHFSIHRLQCKLGDNTDLNLSGTVTSFALDGRYDIRMHFKDLLFTSEPTPDALVYSRAVLDKISPGLRKFLQQYNPRGLSDIDVRTEGKFGRLAENTWAGSVTCRDISVLDEKFPYRLDNITGLLNVTEKSVTLNNLKCRHGDVDLLINGHTQRVDRKWCYDVQITSSNMLLDDDLHKALNTEQKWLWFPFAPKGLARVNYILNRRPGRERKTALVVELLDAQAVYQHFPYPLKNLTGTVYIEPGSLKLDRVVSRYGGRSITMKGRITHTQTERPRYHITIDANDIPIDSTLKMALPAKHREFYESFVELNALTDVHIKVFPNEVGTRPVEYIAKAGIKNASFIYEKFPLPLTNVNIEAILTPDLVRLDRMTGKSGDGTVAVTGKLWPPDENELMPGYCLSVEAKDLELDEKWLRALPPEATGLIDQIRPSGKVNISADISAGAGATGCAPYRLAIECLGTEINLRAFPYPIKNVTGSITVTAENILLENLTATGPQSVSADLRATPKIALNGRLVTRNAEVISGSLTLNAQDVELNDVLARALPENASSVYRAVSPAGTVDLHIDEAIFHTDTDARRWLNLAGARLEFRECSFVSPQTLDEFNAVLTGDISYELKRGLRSARADLNADTLKVRDRVLRSLCAPIIYDPENTTFVSDRFTADFYRGKVIGTLELKQLVGKVAPYALSLVFDDVDIDDILTPPGQKNDSETHTHGSADGAFTAAGRLGKKASSMGRLNINITDMKLARRSLLGKVLTAMQLDDPTDFIFSGMTVAAYLKESEIVFERVYMSGKSMVLAGSGRLDLESNEIVLDLNASGKRITSKPSFLESLAKGLGSAVVKVEVRGDVEKPNIQTTMPLIKNPLEILGTKP
ncbi:MAG TPA: hypothetical protein HPP87_11435 [Planctomycetes bacterium]|nr:hypothetical protein [Planctomycetota bacterium]